MDKNLKLIFGRELKGVMVRVSVDLYSAFIGGSHSRRWGMDHTVLPANYIIPTPTSHAFTRWCHHCCRHPIPAYYSLIDPERM